MSNNGAKYIDSLKKHRLIMRDGQKCFYCGHIFTESMEGWDSIHIDHLKSKKESGDEEMENLRLCCRSCNSSKGKQSFLPNSPKLEEFCKYRKTVRKHEEDWAKSMFSFLKDQRDKGKTEWPLIHEPIIAVMKGITELKITRCHPTNPGWIYMTYKGYEWCYDTRSCVLQANFLNDHSQNNKNKQIAENEGYHNVGGTHHMKYLTPFDEHEIEQGAEKIFTEIKKIIDC